MSRAALIAGASGLVGSHCLSELLAAPDYDRVFALVRRPLPLNNSKLTELRADTAAIPALPWIPGAAVFCAIGTTIRKAGSQAAFRSVDFDYPLAIAKAALAAGATDFVLVSSVGADASSGTFYLRVKGELEDAIGGLAYRSFHVLQPSILLGDREESRPAERAGILLARAFQFVLVGGLSKYRPIAGRYVGHAMVRCMKPGASGRHVYQWRDITAISGSR